MEGEDVRGRGKRGAEEGGIERREGKGRGRDCVFFFQAEDGIRDIGVTGVQTCALPIWEIIWESAKAADWSPWEAAQADYHFLEQRVAKLEKQARDIHGTGTASDPIAQRSEERRVGKECRSRRSPYH